MHKLRMVVPFLIAPLATPLTFMAFDLARHVLVSPSQILFYFFTYGIFAYLATLIFGVPAFFIFRFFRLSNVIFFVIGGATIGFVVSLFVMEPDQLAYSMNRLPERLLCALAGGLSALVFRVLWPRELASVKSG